LGNSFSSKANITTVIWSAGFRTDYSWLEIPLFDGKGYPVHQRGVTTVLSRLYRTASWLNPLSYVGNSRDLPNMFDIIMNSLQTLQCELGNFKSISADVRINPDLSHLTWIEFYRPDELIERGALAAERALPDIKRALAKRLPVRADGNGQVEPATARGTGSEITLAPATGASARAANGVRLGVPSC